MRLIQWMLIAVFAVLQGIAPLLHAHVAEGPHNGQGVHVANLAAPDLPAAWTWGTGETPSINISEQFRKAADLMPCGAPGACLPAAPQAPRELRLPDIVAASARLPGAPAFRQPPAQGPPGPPAAR